MTEIKKLKELLIHLIDYPHMPYWATLEEAFAVLNFSYDTGHDTILIFDEFYRLLGVLHQREVLRGLRLKFELSPEKASSRWGELMESAIPEQLKKPVKDFMVPINVVADVEDDILKAADLLLRHSIGLLPVKESERIIGVVTMHNIFHEIAGLIL